MKKRAGILVVILISIGSIVYAQDDATNVDSLTTNVLQSVFVDDPEHVSNEESDSTKRSSFNVYPYAFYTPESKLAAGAGGIYIFYTNESQKDLKPSKIGFGGYYTSNNQYRIRLNPSLYFHDNKFYFEQPTYFGYFVDKYWGIGDDTADRDSAAYSQRTFSTILDAQIPPSLFMADLTGIIFSYETLEIVDKMGNELLLNDSLPGANGSTQFGLGTDLLWDSRDNIFFPNSGIYQYIKIMFYTGLSDYVYSSLESDLKFYYSFSPDHVFAVNMYIQSVVGEIPFYSLPSVGGSKRLRGYFFGRYRDNFYGMMQMEYRQYFYKRFGFAVFAGTGNVSHNVVEYDFSNLKYSYGFGLRYMFNKQEKVNLRVDLGFGNDGNWGIYFGIQEAF